MHPDSIGASEGLQLPIAAGLGLQDFHLMLRRSFSSQHPQHRQEIREALLQSLVDRQCQPEVSRILDLGILPSAEEVSISISHCKAIGGFALASSSTPLGFDVEVTERILYSRIEKVCHDLQEQQESPSASSLWVAKEATFKALHRSFPEVGYLSQLKLGRWRTERAEISERALTSTASFEFFELTEVQKLPKPFGPVPANLGCVVELGEIKLGFFTFGSHCVRNLKSGW